jgi:hypothetical protein
MSSSKVYLGDSVYAEVDGDNLLLTTCNGGVVANSVYLEPEVLAALLTYLDHPLKEDTTTLTLYYHQSPGSDSIAVKSYEYTYDEDVVLIAVREVRVPAVPSLSHADLINRIVARLRDKQTAVRLTAFDKDKELEDKIQNLLALPAPDLDVPQ